MLLGVLLVFKFNKMAMILIVQFHYTSLELLIKFLLAYFKVKKNFVK